MSVIDKLAVGLGAYAALAAVAVWRFKLYGAVVSARSETGDPRYD